MQATTNTDIELRSGEMISSLQPGVQVVFNVRHTQPPNNSVPGKIKRDAIYFAIYRVFEEEQGGRDIQTHLNLLKEIAARSVCKRDNRLMHFITKNAHWHAYGEFASDESTHMLCLKLFLDSGHFQTSIDLRWCVNYMSNQKKLNWLEMILDRPVVLDNDWHVFSLIQDSIHRYDPIEILDLFLKILKPRRDLRALDPSNEPTSENTRNETLLHLFMRTELPDTQRLQMLLRSQDPYFLNKYNQRPLEILEDRISFFTHYKRQPPIQLTLSVAMMHKSEETHDPVCRDLVLALGHLSKSGSLLRLLDGELLRIIARSARLDYYTSL